jgi:hypothetical protein
MIILPLCDEQKYIFDVNESIEGITMVPSYSIKFSKDFSDKELIFAVDQCIKGADVFSARCVVKDKQPYMEFLPYVKPEIPVLNFATEEEYEKFCKRVIKKNINNRDKLYYIFIYSIAGSYNHIHFTVNHLIMDTISILLLMDKIEKVLLGLEKEVIWHPFSAKLEKTKDYKGSEKYLRDKEFWEERFLEYSKGEFLFEEPVDTEEREIKELRFTISKDNKKKIFDYCTSHNISVHLLIITILSKFTNKKTGLERFYFDVTVGNRIGKNEKNSLGIYEVANPYSFDFSSNPEMMELYESISKQRMGYYKHQQFDYATQPYTNEYMEKYGEFKLQFCFSYLCTNKKPDFSIATLVPDKHEVDLIPMTMLVSDYTDWEEMTFDYIYLENYLDDEEVIEIHKEIEKRLLDIIKGDV